MRAGIVAPGSFEYFVSITNARGFTILFRLGTALRFVCEPRILRELFMKSTSILLFICLLACIGLTSYAQPPGRDSQKEAKILQGLQTIAPAATVDKFRAATAALDAQNYEESIGLYREVLTKAPDFEPALRRAGGALVSVGRKDEGFKMIRRSVDLNRSPDNLFSLAVSLSGIGKPDSQPTKPEIDEALRLSKEAMQKDTTGDADYASAVAEFALSSDAWDDFVAASDRLAREHPELVQTRYFNAVRAADAGEFDRAETEIAAAEQLGLPPETAAPFRAAVEKAKSERYYGLGNYFYYGAVLVAVWALGLLALFVAGKILSAKTLRAIDESDPNDATGGGHASLKNIYRRVINIAGVYYYVSQPIVALLVLAASGGIILFFFYIGTIPIKLVVIVGFIALATVFYMVKSLFARTEIEDPGRVLTEAEAPGLWTLARDVAQAIDTRAVNEIRITHGSELAVYERGTLREKLNDKAERVLIVGVATLNDFSQNAFRAVLAHEYGHFSHRDTAGGDAAMRVNNDIMRLAYAMAVGGTATVYNIAFQFLRLYHFIFRRITHGATRLQEVLADRVAVRQYGADAFREGLTHVIRRDIEFNHVAEREINAAFGANRQMQNLYELNARDDEAAAQSIEQAIKDSIDRPTTEDDTHPSPHARFALASRIKSKKCAALPGMVWDLFADRAAVTNEMNKMLETRVRAAM